MTTETGTKKTEKPTLGGWKIIFSYLANYRSEIATLSLLGIFSALANGSVPFLVGKFLDSLISYDKVFFIFGYFLPLWAGLLILWAIVQFIANSADFVIARLSSKIGTLIHTDYISEASALLLTLPVSFHKEEKTGEIWDRVNRASNSLSNLSESVIINLTPQILSVFIGIIIAFSINALLASILLLGIIIYLLALAWVVPPIALLQKDGHKAWNEAYGVAWDAVSNYQTIKHSTAEEHEKKKIKEKFYGEVFLAWYKVEKIWANIRAFQRFVILFTQLAIFIVSAGLVAKGALSIGSLISLNGYAAMVFGPFVSLGNQWATIQNGIVSVTRAEEILTLPSENKDRGKKITTPLSGQVTFKNVSFHYQKNEKDVLSGLNLDISPGKVVALVGQSGVGKSTVIQLISGYYLPTKGDILVDGYNTKEVDLYDLRRHIAVVPQEVVLFNDSVLNNIRYGSFNATLEEVKEAAKEAHADIFIEQFPEKYNQLVGERGIKLSVGEKQRIAIARAILRNPKILILDEPTSALDPQTERNITDSLEKLMRGRTTFIIAHRLSTVRRADTIFVFDKGAIVEEGTHEELLAKNGLYRKLHDLHIGLS